MPRARRNYYSKSMGSVVRVQRRRLSPRMFARRNIYYVVCIVAGVCPVFGMQVRGLPMETRVDAGGEFVFVLGWGNFFSNFRNGFYPGSWRVFCLPGIGAMS